MTGSEATIVNARQAKQDWFVIWMMLVPLTRVELRMPSVKQVSSMARISVAAQLDTQDITAMKISMSARKVRNCNMTISLYLISNQKTNGFVSHKLL